MSRDVNEMLRSKTKTRPREFLF